MKTKRKRAAEERETDVPLPGPLQGWADEDKPEGRRDMGRGGRWGNTNARMRKGGAPGDQLGKGCSVEAAAWLELGRGLFVPCPPGLMGREQEPPPS